MYHKTLRFLILFFSLADGLLANVPEELKTITAIQQMNINDIKKLMGTIDIRDPHKLQKKQPLMLSQDGMQFTMPAGTLATMSSGQDLDSSQPASPMVFDQFPLLKNVEVVDHSYFHPKVPGWYKVHCRARASTSERPLGKRDYINIHIFNNGVIQARTVVQGDEQNHAYFADASAILYAPGGKVGTGISCQVFIDVAPGQHIKYDLYNDANAPFSQLQITYLGRH